MRVVLVSPVSKPGGGVHPVGSEMELDDESAARLVRIGAAVMAPEPLPHAPAAPHATTEAAPETAPPKPDEAPKVHELPHVQRSAPRAHSSKKK